MTTIILLMALQNSGNLPSLDGFAARRARPAVVRQDSRPVFRRLFSRRSR